MENCRILAKNHGACTGIAQSRPSRGLKTAFSNCMTIVEMIRCRSIGAWLSWSARPFLVFLPCLSIPLPARFSPGWRCRAAYGLSSCAPCKRPQLVHIFCISFILTKMVQRSKVFLTLCTPEASLSSLPAHKARLVRHAFICRQFAPTRATSARDAPSRYRHSAKRVAFCVVMNGICRYPD